MKRDISAIANSLAKKYVTRDPIEIAEELGIEVAYRNLGKINGYYNTIYGSKVIRINRRLDERKKQFVAAHELGHAILHGDMSTPFMREHTYFSIDKFEIEANTFAVNLLILDSELSEYQREGFTVQQIAGIYHLPEEFINLRIYGTMNY